MKPCPAQDLHAAAPPTPHHPSPQSSAPAHTAGASAQVATVSSAAPGLGFFVNVKGMVPAYFYHEDAAHEKAGLLNEFAARIVLECAKKVVKVGSDFAAGLQGECDTEERAVRDVVEEIRKALMEGVR